MATAIIFLFSCGGDDDLNPSDDISPTDDNMNPPLGGLTMLSRLPMEDSVISDVWGYFNEGREYAIVGDISGIAKFYKGECDTDPGTPKCRIGGSVVIVDVTDPTSPEIVSVIPDVLGQDVKDWKNYLYISNGGLGPASIQANPSAIFDISDPANPIEVGTFPDAHNVFIDENGYMYLPDEDVNSGLSIYDLNQNPADPVFVWVDTEPTIGHDATVIGNRLYDFHWDLGTIIYDISNPTDPLFLSRIDQLGITHHSGWATDDNSILVISDELRPLESSGVNLTIWNVSDPSNPILMSTIIVFNDISHNVYINDRILYVSFYDAGLRVYDLEDPSNPVLLDRFETNINGGIGIGQGIIISDSQFS